MLLKWDKNLERHAWKKVSFNKLFAAVYVVKKTWKKREDNRTVISQHSCNAFLTRRITCKWIITSLLKRIYSEDWRVLCTFILQKGSNPLPEFVTHEELKSDSTNFESVCDMGIIVKWLCSRAIIYNLHWGQFFKGRSTIIKTVSL